MASSLGLGAQAGRSGGGGILILAGQAHGARRPLESHDSVLLSYKDEDIIY